MNEPAKPLEYYIESSARWLPRRNSHETRVSVVQDLEQVGISLSSTKITSEFFGRIDHTVLDVAVMPDWLDTVHRRGLAVLYGHQFRGWERVHVTLDAHLVETEGNFSVYRAIWARPGRGYRVDAHRGYIARGCKDQGAIGFVMPFAHADTPERALKVARWRLAYWSRRERRRLELGYSPFWNGREGDRT